MEIIAITPYTGSEKLVQMTEDCIRGLVRSKLPPGATLRICATNNAASRSIDLEALRAMKADYPHLMDVDQVTSEKNEGFGIGVNKAIDFMLFVERWPCRYILVFNNDLVFERDEWLLKLVWEADGKEGRFVCCPRTDVTATKEACFPGPAEDDSHAMVHRHHEVSAYCWLLPVQMIHAILDRFDFPLFCPQFSNYGSDDATAAILRKIYGATPFKIVPRSWVKHLKAQTANELGVRAGTAQLLTDLKKWKRSNGLR
jgi:hypothetical protein